MVYIWYLGLDTDNVPILKCIGLCGFIRFTFLLAYNFVFFIVYFKIRSLYIKCKKAKQAKHTKSFKINQIIGVNLYDFQNFFSAKK